MILYIAILLFGGVLTRIAARKSKHSKVIYTAHGFHFYKGAPKRNWILYYPIEKILARNTDVLITINNEDYNIAKRKFKTKKIYKFDGVGVDESKFNTKEKINREEYLKEISLKKKDYVFLSIGELNENKNQIMQLNAMKIVVKKCPNARLLIAGDGCLKSFYYNYIYENDLENCVRLLGYRKDISKILKCVDCVISTSKREGLPVNLIEAMFCNKPIIASNIRGNIDLIDDESVFSLDDVDELAKKMTNNIEENKIMQNYDIEKYKIENILRKYEFIYNEFEKEYEKGCED